MPPSPYYQPDYMALMKKFHPAGDNKLTTEEWQALNKQVQADREKWDLDHYDTNHDGKLDAAEKKARNDSYVAYSAEVTRYYELITWDKNKDGHLDEQELAALHAYKEKLRVQTEQARRNYEEMVRKFDVDGDGKLDEKERKAMYEEYARQAEIKQYDTNGDGVLDEKERAEMEAEKAQWKKVAELQKQYYMKKYDLNGDGKISPEEQKAVMEDYQRKYIARWDTDGDGKLSPAEMKAMSETLTARYAKMRRQMDLNGDGEVTPAESRAYQKKQLEKYDTNKDGWIDPEEQERQNDDLDDYPDD
jgi:Ca2+-binding EF-hand superfamily protein